LTSPLQLAASNHPCSARHQRACFAGFAFAAVSSVLSISSIAHAASLPEGPSLVAGAANIVQTDGDRPSMTIQQQSKTALLQWQSFGIAPQASVNVHSEQPDSLLINRVVGDAPSVIEGELHSDGSVWLINPNGISWVAGSHSDTRALLTSHHDIEPALLMSAARALLAQPAPLADVRPAGEADTVNVLHALLPVTPESAREAALARIAIEPPAIPRYLLSPEPQASAEVASLSAWRAASNLGSQRTVSEEPLSGQRIYTWFASPSMATPLPGMDPYSSDESDY